MEQEQNKTYSEKSCLNCNTAFTPTHHAICYCCDTCRVIRQTARKKEAMHAWNKANYARLKPHILLWQKQNPDKLKKMRADYYRRHKDKEKQNRREWFSNNRQRYNSNQLEYLRRKTAITDGKKMNVKEFALIRTRNGFWFAAKIGRRISGTERVMANYKIISGVWVISAPPFSSADLKDLSKKLTLWERRNKKRKR